MREIEYTAYLVNRVALGGLYGEKEISAPRIDMTWGFKGYPVDEGGNPLPPPAPLWQRVLRRTGEKPEDGEKKDENPDWRADEPERREPEKIYKDLGRCYWWPNVLLPHALAVALGLLLFVIFAALNASGVDHMRL